MGLVGDVTVMITADSQKFVTAVEKAQDKYKGFGESLTKVGKIMTVGVTGPIAAVVGSLGAMINSTRQAADQMLLLSQKSGISTDTLQELKFAGDLAGVSIETIANSSAMLTRNLVDASNGMGEAVKTVNALGIQTKDANGQLLSQEALLLNSLDALMKLGPGTAQAAATMELFGRAGKEMLPILATGAAGIDELRAQAQKLGVVMSGETIAAFDTLDDELYKIGAAFTGAGQRIAASFIPILRDDLFPFIEGSLIPAIVKVGSVVADLAKWFASLSTPVKLVIGSMVALAAAIGPVLLAVGALMPGISAMIGAWPVLVAAMSPVVAAIAAISAPVWLVVGAVGAMGAAWLYFSNEIIDGVAVAIDFLVDNVLNTAIGAINQWVVGFNDLFGTSLGIMETFKVGAGGVGEAIKVTMKDMDLAVRGWAESLIYTGDTVLPALTEAAAPTTAAVNALGAATKKTTEGLIELHNAGLMAADAPGTKTIAIEEFNDNLKETNKAGIAAAFSFKGMDQNIGALLSKSGGIKGFAKGLASMGLDKLSGFIPGGGIIRGGFKKIFGFAKGGIIHEPTAMIGLKSGGLGIMGEAGPEAIVPMGGGNRGGGLSGGLTVNVYGSVGVDDIGNQIIQTLRRNGLA